MQRTGQSNHLSAEPCTTDEAAASHRHLQRVPKPRPWQGRCLHSVTAPRTRAWGYGLIISTCPLLPPQLPRTCQFPPSLMAILLPWPDPSPISSPGAHQQPCLWLCPACTARC